MIYDFKAVAQLNKGDDISSSGKTLYSTIWANETRAAWCQLHCREPLLSFSTKVQWKGAS